MQSRLQLPTGPMVTINIAPGLAKDYEITSEKIGSGSFGTAYKAIFKSNPNKELIIKYSAFSTDAIVKKGYDPIKLLVDGLATIEMIKKNPHPIIVNYEFVGIDLETKNLYEVMEYCNDGDVYSKNDLTQEEVLDACYQVASALDHLHSLKITHRDVKSDNVYVQKDQFSRRIFKLADFSFSCMKTDIKTHTGNELFRAPEVFDNVPLLTNKIDIWGLGVIFYHAIFKEFPFDGRDARMIKSQVRKGFEYPLQKAKTLKLHPKVQQLLEGMLNKDPTNRFSAKSVMKSVDEIRNARSATLLDVPVNLLEIKMKDGICLSERGIVKMNNQIYFTIDRSGNVQKINSSNNNIIIRQQFDVGNPFDASSIITNNTENLLIVSGSDNKNIYAVDPNNLQTTRMWKETHTKNLSKTIFLDNKVFCVGYDGGLLKKYHVDYSNELAKFELCENWICTFYVDNNSSELLIGDRKGTLYSIDWKLFNKVNWSIKIHQSSINSICKSGSFFATGSNGKSFALLNSLNPPEVINRVQTDSLVYQLQLTTDNNNLLVLCLCEFVLFQINAERLLKVCQKSYQADFKNQGLQSFALLNDNNVVVGDQGGNLFSMKLLKQAMINSQQIFVNMLAHQSRIS